MFTIRFETVAHRPDLQITLRNSVDGWDHDVPGIYEDDAWRFELDEARYGGEIELKLVLERTYWMLGANLRLPVFAGAEHVLTAAQIDFPKPTEVIVESSHFQQTFFAPTLDEGRVFDVIVIGSGIGGGILADQLTDLGVDVLVLEAGSLLFPTHVANLPRQHVIGKFDKHVWRLYEAYKVVNYENAPGSTFDGAQGLNLGGRSIFWGGLIPRMTWWEMEPWPARVKSYLENAGYQRAEDLMYWPASPSSYQQDFKTRLRNVLPDFDHFDAPVAVRQLNPAFGTIAPGLFSTADLLTESRLTADSAGNEHLSVNLNHAVVRIETAGGKATRVVAQDLLVRTKRTFTGKIVVLAAGTIESAKIAKLSGLHDPHGLVGVGITDHPIFYTHFLIPQGALHHSTDSQSKTLSRHKQATRNAHPYNVVVELGADLNQGRYVDPDLLRRHKELKGNAMLCEIVFLFDSGLLPQNRLEQLGASHVKPLVHMQESPSADAFWAEIDGIKDRVIAELGGEAITGDDLSLHRARLGGVGHEVGTLRMGTGDAGVVDENLKFIGYDNLYVCDLSVFPTSPAANPTLTLAALSLGLAEHIMSVLGG
jgi:hypothetical protein